MGTGDPLLLTVLHVLEALLPNAIPVGLHATVSLDIEITSLFILTPVIYAAIDGALSVV